MDKLCPLIRRYLEVQFDDTHVQQEQSLVTNLVVCWARLVSIVSEEGGMVKLQRLLMVPRMLIVESL